MDATALLDLSEIRELARIGRAREIRVGAGLTLGEVAGHVGATPTTVYRWERGLRIPHGAAAVAYCRLLRQLAEQRA